MSTLPVLWTRVPGEIIGELMKKKIVHICPLNRNVGDNALNKAIKSMLAPAFEIESMELVGNPFGRAEFEVLNAADAVIFGGGGVIHSCSGGSSRKNRERTGTMWNMDLDMIRALKSKIILYSVGFNKFEGEPEPLVRMGEFFDVLNSKSALVSFRNDLSKERFLQYFPRFGGIEVTPDPGLFCRGSLREGSQGYALLQIACDRLEYRYPQGLKSFVSLLHELCAISPVPVYLIPHTTADSRIYFANSDILGFDSVFNRMIEYADVGKVMDLYRNALFTISTRGHSQICSVGNGTPTFAMSTHPKARGFMEEIGQVDACFDYLHEDPNICVERFKIFLEGLPRIRKELVAANERFDREIDDFNSRIYKFVYEDWTPPALLTNPEATPLRQAVTIATEDGQAPKATAKEIVETGSQIKTNKATAYLPGRIKEVGTGTFSFGLQKKTPPPVGNLTKWQAWQRFSRNWRLLPRSKRTSDGATCGLVISCDANYFPGVATCINAVRRYNPRLPITFLDAGLTAEQAERVRAIVDDYKPIEELRHIAVRTFPSHLSKAALSSLYCHLADYDKVLYLDVDALVLDDLSPLFEALDGETDIVGIQGNYFNRLLRGYKHETGSEIHPDGVVKLKRMFPAADVKAPGINSGCFAVWSNVAENWQSTVHELLPYLRYFKTADQALLNVLISIRGLRLKLFDPAYNCMGFQLSERRHLVQELCSHAEIDADTCRLYLAGRRLKVAHFAGRNKPWLTSIDSPASFAWDWHAAESGAERLLVASFFRLSEARSHNEFLAIAEAEKSKHSQPFEFLLKAAHTAKRRQLTGAAHELYGEALKRKPKSASATRNLMITGAQSGDLLASVDRFRKSKKLKASTSPELVKFQAQAVPAVDGGSVTGDAELHESRRRQLRLRALVSIRKPNVMLEELPLLSVSDRKLPELFLLESYAVGMSSRQGAAQLVSLYRSDAALVRRLSNEAIRSACVRLDALGGVLRAHQNTGSVAQIGAGSGVFLQGASNILGSVAVAIDNGISEEFFPEGACGIGRRAVESLDGARNEYGTLILANVLDRFDTPKEVLAGLAGLVSTRGLIIVVDLLNRNSYRDCIEGLGALVPQSRALRIEDMAKGTGLSVEGSWLVDGERIVALRKTETSFDEAPLIEALAKLRMHVDTISGALADARTEAVTEATAKRLAGMDFSVHSVLGGLLDDGGGQVLLTDAPRLPNIGNDTTVPAMPAATKQEQPRSMHFGYWSSINAGDKVLLEQVSLVFEKRLPEVNFVRVDINRPVGNSRLESLRQSKFVLLGGGGIFHSTSGANGVTQWNITPETLEKIDVPMVLFAVGFNEFRGTEFYSSDIFKKTMRTVAERSVFIGLREKRSCDILRNIVPEHAEKIFYQPCPTLILPSQYPTLLLERSKPNRKHKHIAINAAFDRAAKRFGSRIRDALNNLDGLVSRLLDEGHKVSVVAHCPEDIFLHSVLKRRDDVGRIPLWGASTETVIAAYNDVDIVLGMRTHSQLIPFGMGIPIVSVITHDKMSWALDDLESPAWGVELFDTEFVDKAAGVANAILADLLNVRLHIRSKIDDLLQVTDDNLTFIRKTLNLDA